MADGGTIKLVDSAAPAAGTVTKMLGIPPGSSKVTLHILATTAGASTVDAKIQQGDPSGTTFTDLTGLTVPQIIASQTSATRGLTWGDEITAQGMANFVSVVMPLSRFQRLSYTLVGTVTNLKIWLEYFEGA